MDRPIEEFSVGFDLSAECAKMEGNPPKEVKKAFFELLRGASYLVPCKPDNHQELSVLNRSDGKAVLPLFTDYAEFRKWPFPKADATLVPYEKLKTIVIDKAGALFGLVINPFGKSLTLSLDQLREIDSVTTGFSYERTQYKGEVRLFAPFVAIPQLNEKLSALFDGFDTVYKAFLLLAQPLKELTPHLILVIDFTGDRTELFPKVAETLQPYLKKGDRFELVKADYKLLSAAEKAANPFYERK